MRVKITLNKALICILAASLFGEGAVFEGISWICMLMLMRGSRKAVIRSVGKKAYCGMLLYVAAFVTLFLVHIFILKDIDAENTLRFFGLTKCVCAPVLFYFVFAKHIRRYDLHSIVMVFMVVMNIFFAHYKFGLGAEFGGYYGSYNVIGGLNALVLPTVCHQLLLKKKLDRWQKVIYPIFFVFAVISLVTYDSTTYIVLIAMQILAMVGLYGLRNRKLKRLVTYGMALACVGALVSMYLIMRGAIVFNNEVLDTRVAIWTRGFDQFLNGSGVRLWLGSGNDIVAMESKVLEAHSMIMEILFIYGVAGLVAFALFFIAAVRFIWKRRSKFVYPDIVLLTLLTYTLTCLIHPFFTGVFNYQWVAMLSIFNLMAVRKVPKAQLVVQEGKNVEEEKQRRSVESISG